MAERWRRDLGLLDRLEPSPELLDRARQGPRLPMPRPRASRRVLAAVVALVVAAGGSVAALAGLHGHGTTTPVEVGQTPFPGLWPEDLLADAQHAQQQADGGDPSVQWRLDPEATAKRFAAEVLGWTDAVVSVADAGSPTGVIVDLSTLPPPCPASGCPPWLLSRHVGIDLDQLVTTGPAGIWSVTAVHGGEFVASYRSSGSNGSELVTGHLELPLRSGQDVASGQEVYVPLVSLVGTDSSGNTYEEQVLAGYAYECGDGTTTLFSTVAPTQDGIAFPVGGSSLSADCAEVGGEPSPGAPGELDRPLDGYVFVVVVHGSNPDEPWVPFGGPPPADVTLVAMAVVPVHFVPAS
jgi:predicted RecA/RadA family phage recombinase